MSVCQLACKMHVASEAQLKVIVIGVCCCRNG